MSKVLTDPAFYTEIADAIRSKLGGSTKYKPSEMAAAILAISSGGGLPAGIKAIDYGSYTKSDTTTTATFTVPHKLGMVPDAAFFWVDGNIAQTNTMLWVCRMPPWAYRSSTYLHYYGYHTNSTTTVSIGNNTGNGNGLSAMSATALTVSAISSTYSWRPGTYHYLAIKFA